MFRVPRLGHVKRTALTAARVQAALADIDKGLSPRSVQASRAVLRSALGREPSFVICGSSYWTGGCGPMPIGSHP